MAIGDEIFIADKTTLDAVNAKLPASTADKPTLDLVKADTTTLKSDTTTLKSDVTAVKTALTGGVVTSTWATDTSDYSNVVANITGSGELLMIYTANAGGDGFRIQIDGATNRKQLIINQYQAFNLKDMGFKFTTSLKVTSNQINGNAVYRLG